MVDKSIRFLSKHKIRIAFAFLLVILLLSFFKCEKIPVLKASYSIGRDPKWTYQNLMGKEKSIIAFSDELLSTIANKKNFRFHLVSVTSKNLQEKLNSHSIDGILSDIQPDLLLKQQYLFSEPFFVMGPVLIVRSDSEVDTIEEVKYKIIGILNNDSPFLELAKDPEIQIKLYDNALKALSDLNLGSIDGVILPSILGYTYAKTFYLGKLKIATPALLNEGLRLITLKNEKGEKLIEEFNEGLKELQEDGTYDRLIKEWNLVNATKVE